MSDPEALRANERYKAVAGVMSNLGTALLAASVVQSYSDGGLGLETGLWLLGSGVLIWIGWMILGLLAPED